MKFIFTNQNSLVDKQARILNFQSLLSESDGKTDIDSYYYHPDSIFTVVFTSGTSGKKKAIEVRTKSFDNFITESTKMFPVISDDKILIFLPLSVYIERCYIYGAILSGFNSLVVSLEYVIPSIMKDNATIVVAVPYFFDTFADMFIKKMKSNPIFFVMFSVYLFLKKIGLGFLLPKQFILFKKALGGKIRYLMTGSAACNKKVLRFYKDMGIILYEGYGMSEVGGMLALNSPDSYRLGSVGKPFPNKEITFDEQGQIFVKCEYNANNHYYKEESKESVTYLSGGIVATGDIGYFDDDGFLYLKGRVKETIVLSNGNKVQPGFIENMLLEASIIKNCYIYGDNKPYITALIVPTDSSVNNSKIGEVILEVNAELARNEQIVKYFISYEAFTVENKMFTDALKINRKFIGEKYKSEFDKLYD